MYFPTVFFVMFDLLTEKSNAKSVKINTLNLKLKIKCIHLKKIDIR